MRANETKNVVSYVYCYYYLNKICIQCCGCSPSQFCRICL